MMLTMYVVECKKKTVEKCEKGTTEKMLDLNFHLNAYTIQHHKNQQPVHIFPPGKIKHVLFRHVIDNR